MRRIRAHDRLYGFQDRRHALSATDALGREREPVAGPLQDLGRLAGDARTGGAPAPMADRDAAAPPMLTFSSGLRSSRMQATASATRTLR